jgi:hypothetical protein
VVQRTQARWLEAIEEAEVAVNLELDERVGVSVVSVLGAVVAGRW